jgi:hypothetical protein
MRVAGADNRRREVTAALALVQHERRRVPITKDTPLHRMTPQPKLSRGANHISSLGTQRRECCVATDVRQQGPLWVKDCPQTRALN